MATVVDAVNFLKDYEEAQQLQEVGESLGEEDERSVADLLMSFLLAKRIWLNPQILSV
jgi:hypothetical protein